jgi:hypothetical protein
MPNIELLKRPQNLETTSQDINPVVTNNNAEEVFTDWNARFFHALGDTLLKHDKKHVTRVDGYLSKTTPFYRIDSGCGFSLVRLAGIKLMTGPFLHPLDFDGLYIQSTRPSIDQQPINLYATVAQGRIEPLTYVTESYHGPMTEERRAQAENILQNIAQSLT